MGPSIASGSQTWSGNWADLPITAKNRSSVTPVAAAVVTGAVQSKVPVATKSQSRPNRKPMSPSLVIQKAFTAAFAAEGLANQKPMSR